MNPISAICLLIVLGCMLMLVQNQRVFNYRRKIIARVNELTIADIESHKEGNIFWRHDALDKVQYNDMVLQFWKPLDSFYEGYDFNIKN